MTLEEFKKKIEEDEEYVPGWDAIEAAMAELYPGQEPAHFGTDMPSRAIFGGNNYLDGFSFYRSPKGYLHLVSFGMTVLYGDEEAFGGEYNGWGYEMTMKLKADDPNECLWAADMMLNLARYTYTSGKWFEHMHYVAGNGDSINQGMPESKMTSLFVINDPELKPQQTVYGETAFLQLVGITYHDAQMLMEDWTTNAPLLYERIKADNPDFVTDMTSTKSYL